MSIRKSNYNRSLSPFSHAERSRSMSFHRTSLDSARDDISQKPVIIIITNTHII